MADVIVVHNQLGEARLLRSLDAGAFWEVRFDRSGQRGHSAGG